MKKKIDFIWILISIVGFGLMSASILFMSTDRWEYFPGILFWTCLLVGITSQIILAVRKKTRPAKKGCIGLICFFRNVPAIIADIIFVVSLIAFVISSKMTHGVGYICYVMLAVCIYTFCLHCIFNGKIFRYVIKKEKEEN